MTRNMTDFSAYDQLYVYAGSRGRETFILQLVVDAHRAQIATDDTKPIALVFALIGLFLHVEKNFTAEDVLKVPAGPERDTAISEWCRSVWAECGASRQQILDLLREHRIV